MNNPSVGQERLIATNMTAINSYSHVLQMNITGLLDSTTDRKGALDRHISLLQSYQAKTSDQIALIQSQRADINEILEKTSADETQAKAKLQSASNTMDYSGVDTAIESFIQSRNISNRARIYAIYLEQFEKSYTLLQQKNKVIFNALVLNRDALINKSKVIIPTIGSNLIEELGLIQKEADYRASEVVQ